MVVVVVVVAVVVGVVSVTVRGTMGVAAVVVVVVVVGVPEPDVAGEAAPVAAVVGVAVVCVIVAPEGCVVGVGGVATGIGAHMTVFAQAAMVNVEWAYGYVPGYVDEQKPRQPVMTS